MVRCDLCKNCIRFGELKEGGGREEPKRQCNGAVYGGDVHTIRSSPVEQGEASEEAAPQEAWPESHFQHLRHVRPGPNPGIQRGVCGVDYLTSTFFVLS